MLRIPQGPIARSTIATSGVMGLRLLIQAGTLIVLARTLGPKDFGTYVALGALATLMGTMAGFGTHMRLLRDVSRLPASRDDSLRTALGTTSAFGILLLAAYVVLSGKWLYGAEDRWIIAICLGTSELLLQPIFRIASVERHARNEIVYAQSLLLLPLLLRLVVALLVAWTAPGEPLVAFVGGYLLSTAVSLAIGIAQTRQPWPRPRQWRLLDRTQWVEASGYALQTASTSGISEMDKMLSAKLLSSASAGIYAAASRAVSALVLPITAMMVSAMPRLFREAVRDSRHLLRWLFACAGTYGIAAGLGIWLAAPLLQAMFGPRYDGVVEIVRWLAWAVPATSLRTTAANVLTTIDQPWPRIALELLGWITIVLLGVMLAPGMHSHGLALAVVAAEWLMACASWWMVRHYSRAKRQPAAIAPRG